MGDPSGRCCCSPEQVQRYRSRVSGPLLDRIDIQVEVPSLNPQYLHNEDGTVGESSRIVRTRVRQAHDRQHLRAGKLNCDLTPREIDRHCRLSWADRALLKRASEHLGLSARAWHRMLKVARSIADLAGEDKIDTQHLSEAIAYRNF